MLKLSYYLVVGVLLASYCAFCNANNPVTPFNGPCPKTPFQLPTPNYRGEGFFKGAFTEGPLPFESVDAPPCEATGLQLRSHDVIIGTDYENYFLMFMCMFDEETNQHFASAVLYTVDRELNPAIEQAAREDLVRNNLSLSYFLQLCK